MQTFWTARMNSMLNCPLLLCNDHESTSDVPAAYNASLFRKDEAMSE